MKTDRHAVELRIATLARAQAELRHALSTEEARHAELLRRRDVADITGDAMALSVNAALLDSCHKRIAEQHAALLVVNTRMDAAADELTAIETAEARAIARIERRRLHLSQQSN